MRIFSERSPVPTIDRLAAASGKAGGILIAGNDQVRNDRGVPWYLARLKPGARTLSIALVEVQDGQSRAPADLPYDYVWFTTRVPGGEDLCAVGGDLGSLPGSD